LLASVFVLTASPTPAQIRPGSVSITPFFGGYTFDSDLHLDTKPVHGLRLGYDITPRWGVEVATDYVSTELEQGGGNVRALGYRLDALYHFMPDKKFVPFIAAGVGGTSLRYPAGMKNDTDLLFDYGGGIKYFFTDALALRADIRQLLVFDGGNLTLNTPLVSPSCLAVKRRQQLLHRCLTPTGTAFPITWINALIHRQG